MDVYEVLDWEAVHISEAINSYFKNFTECKLKSFNIVFCLATIKQWLTFPRALTWITGERGKKLHCQQWMHQNKKLINNTHRQQFSKHTSCFKRHDTDLLSKFQANSSQKKIFATSCPLNIAFFTNVCCLFHGILYLFLNSTNGSLKNNFFSTEGKLRHG